MSILKRTGKTLWVLKVSRYSLDCYLLMLKLCRSQNFTESRYRPLKFDKSGEIGKRKFNMQTRVPTCDTLNPTLYTCSSTLAKEPNVPPQ